MRLALIGKKLGHSLSVPIHQAYFALSGKRGSYDLLELPPERLDCLRELMLAEGFDGVNVTIPYKRAVMSILDDVTDTARQVGAVNTIGWRDGRLVGHNTDADGFLQMLAFAGIPVRDKRFAVLGATGGAAQAVLAALVQGGAQWVYPVSRRGEITYSDLPRLDYHTLVNCTPVGMWPDTDASPVDGAAAARAQALVDLVYNPPVSKFLSMAAPGAKAVNGLYMLVAQALLAQAFWQGEDVDPSLVNSIYRRMAGEARP